MHSFAIAAQFQAKSVRTSYFVSLMGTGVYESAEVVVALGVWLNGEVYRLLQILFEFPHNPRPIHQGLEVLNHLSSQPDIVLTQTQDHAVGSLPEVHTRPKRLDVEISAHPLHSFNVLAHPEVRVGEREQGNVLGDLLDFDQPPNVLFIIRQHLILLIIQQGACGI